MKLTKGRLKKLAWTIFFTIIAYIIRTIIFFYVPITNDLIKNIMENFGIIVAIIAGLICAWFLIKWKIDDWNEQKRKEMELFEMYMNTFTYCKIIFKINNIYLDSKNVLQKINSLNQLRVNPLSQTEIDFLNEVFSNKKKIIN